MSVLLLTSSIHLGVELLGAIVFFIVAWILFEAYRIKKDIFGLGRFFGFLLLSAWQVVHAVYGGATFALNYLYIAGLVLLLLSYALEKLPPRPDKKRMFVFLPFVSLVAGHLPLISTILLFLISLFLVKRYFGDIEKLLKWLAWGFGFLALASLASVFAQSEFNDSFWIVEHILKMAGFLAVGFWVWQWLMLRLREELLIVFVGSSLFIALLVTSVFSAVLTERNLRETENNLKSNALVLEFYIESLKSKSLAAVQIIARDDDFISALRFKDLADLKRIGRELIDSTGQDFLTIAGKNGKVILKINFPIGEDENILREWIGGEAFEGRPAVSLGEAGKEGFSIRAASPIMHRGEIIGTLITGKVLDSSFVNNFKKISNLETTVASGEKVTASTAFGLGERIAAPDVEEGISRGESFIGSTKFQSKEIIGAFLPLKDAQNQVIGALAMTTTPGEILQVGQGTERLTLLVIFIIVVILIIPLYRLTIFLTV